MIGTFSVWHKNQLNPTHIFSLILDFLVIFWQTLQMKGTKFNMIIKISIFVIAFEIQSDCKSTFILHNSYKIIMHALSKAIIHCSNIQPKENKWKNMVFLYT